jgi:nucleotide sugar dehydrogenase
MTTIVIQGHGVVGQSTELFLKKFNPDLKIVFSDPHKEISPLASDWTEAEYIVVCVNTDLDDMLPTPENSTVNVDAAINEAIQKGFTGKVVLRSTSGIECVTKLQNFFGDNLITWPEYIREATWQEDAVNPSVVVIGGEFAEEFSSLFAKFSGTVILTDTLEAMIAKLTTNTFLAMKVIFANQVQQLCKANSASYEVVKQLLENEGRLGRSHWSVPGLDGEPGFAGKCFPKDVKTFEAALIKSGIHVDLIRAISVLNQDMRTK